MSYFTSLPLTKILSGLWIAFIGVLGFSSAAISHGSEVPWITVNTTDIVEGEWVRVLCGVPIDYTGGICRLYRDERRKPFMTVQTRPNTWFCEFLLSSKDLLGIRRRPGTQTTVRCDYTLQNYVSASSNNKIVVVWGTLEKPVLTVSPLVVMMDGRVQLNCTPPTFKSTTCHVYREEVYLDQIPCHHVMRGEELMKWEKTSLFNEINVSCKYKLKGQDYVESEASHPVRTLVVDPSKMELSTHSRNGTFLCDVPSHIQDFVQQHTGNESLGLELGGTLKLQAINNSTGPFNQMCRYV